MRIALAGSSVSLAATGAEPGDRHLALGLLASWLMQQAEAEVARVELPISLDDPSLSPDAADRILANDPELVGLSTYCWDEEAFKPVIRELRLRAPSTPIVLGGPSVTFDGLRLLRESPGATLAVRGEGEQTLVELVRGGLDHPGQVPGVIWRDGSELRESPHRIVFDDLGVLPSPYRVGVMKPPRGQMQRECSRGCGLRCKYCAWKGFMGGLRFAPPASVAADAAWALENGEPHIFLLDSALNFSSAHLDALTAAIADVVPLGRVAFSYFLSQAHLEPQQIDMLSRITPHEVWLGLESFNERALRVLGRPYVDPSRFAAILDTTSVLTPVQVSVMVGIPGDDLAGFRRTIDTLVAIGDSGPRKRLSGIRVFWLLTPPGSHFYERRSEHGIRLPERGLPYVLESSSFPADQMREAFRFLAEHPRRDLFLYDDPDPSRFYDGLTLEARVGVSATAEPSGALAPPVQLSLETVDRLLPGLVPGVRLPGGWSLVRSWLRDGWPTLTVRAAGRTLDVQIRGRNDEAPCYARTDRYDLLWIASGASDRGDDASVHRLMGAITEAVRRREHEP